MGNGNAFGVRQQGYWSTTDWLGRYCIDIGHLGSVVTGSAGKGYGTG